MKLLRILLYTTVVSCLLFSIESLRADVTVKKETDVNNHLRLIIDNRWVHLSIAPFNGGQVDHFNYKPWGDVDIIPTGTGNTGLFLDHFWQQSWPGELLFVPYEYSIIESGPKQVKIKLWRVANGGGMEILSDILVEKTITVTDDSPCIECQVRLTNNGKVGKLPGYWSQQVIWLNGSTENNVYYRPTLRGVRINSFDVVTPHGKEDYLRDPQAGWSAAVHTQTGAGMVFLMDYAYLQWLYNCIGAFTVEWQDDRVAIPVGKTWETRILALPTEGFHSFTWASRDLLADSRFAEGDKTMQVTHTLSAATTPLKKVVLHTELYGALSHWTEKLPTVTFENLDSKPQTQVQTVSSEMKEHVVIRVTAEGETQAGQTFSEHYEDFYGGKFGDNKQTDGSPIYRLSPVPRKKMYLKPDRIERIKAAAPKILYAKGLDYQLYGLDDICQAVGAKVSDTFHFIGVMGPSLSSFPASYDELMSYDAVILANIDSWALSDAGLEMLKDYVNHGGALLLLGGQYAYGQGKWRGTQMEDLCPVQLGDPFDIKRMGKEGAAIKQNATSTFCAGISWKQSPVCLRLHQVKVKPEAEVVLTCAGNPFLVTWKVGEGRVAACLGTLYGQASKGKVAYWQWDQWPQLMRNVIQWLVGR